MVVLPGGGRHVGRLGGVGLVGVVRLAPAFDDELHEGAAVAGLGVPGVDQPVAALEGFDEVVIEGIDEPVADPVDALEPKPHVEDGRFDLVADAVDGGAVGAVDVEVGLDDAVVTARLVESGAGGIDLADVLAGGPGVDPDHVGKVVTVGYGFGVHSREDREGVHREPDLALLDHGEENFLVAGLAGLAPDQLAAVYRKGGYCGGILAGDGPIDDVGDRFPAEPRHQGAPGPGVDGRGGEGHQQTERAEKERLADHNRRSRLQGCRKRKPAAGRGEAAAGYRAKDPPPISFSAASQSAALI